MKKILIVLIALIFSLTQTAQALTNITVVNKSKISSKNGLITFKVTNLPKANGIYISQCMAIKQGEITPSACNSAMTSKLWISDVPADIKMGAKSSKSKLTLKVDKYFENGDCVHTKCILFISNDHNASSDQSENQAIPFKFSGINLF